MGHVEWYVKSHSNIDKAVPFLAKYKPLKGIPPYQPGSPAERAIKEVVAKIQKQADDEKTEAFSSAKAAALAYHKNISMAHLAYHYKLTTHWSRSLRSCRRMPR